MAFGHWFIYFHRLGKYDKTITLTQLKQNIRLTIYKLVARIPIYNTDGICYLNQYFMVLTGNTINVAIFLTVISIILCRQWQSCLDAKHLNLDRDDPVQKRIQNPPSRASNMELLAKIVNGWKPFTVFAKSSILDVWLGSEYTSAVKHLWWTFFVKIALCAKKVSKYGVFSGPYFPVFGLNTRKYGPEKTPYSSTFHAV